MENSNQRKSEILQESILSIITIIGSIFAAFLYKKTIIEMIQIAVMMGIGVGATLFAVAKCRVTNTYLFDNEQHLWRFSLVYVVFFVAAAFFPLLPETGCPFLAIYVAFILFSNEIIGFVSGTSILIFVSLLNQTISFPVFFIYLIAGIVGILLFSTINEKFKIWIPMLVSLLLQFVLLCIKEILLQNETFGIQMLWIPAINIVVNLILLLIILKFFSFSFIYKTRDLYMDINDPECILLVELKNQSRDEYFHTIHTAYLCSRIAVKLGLDDAVTKACGYYHRIGLLKGENSWANARQIMLENKIPEQVQSILGEYLDPTQKIISREAVVLLFSDTIISSINYLFSKDPSVELDYNKLINAIFKKKIDSGIMDNSKISLSDIQIMKKILIEERLYYDFLR